ncbi:MAG: MarR family transcriptional regulator [Propionibacteriaceae bacterium]|jgi:DNA-binding MarR family transcriptional regulator|nr:MarR family transcriptional regulator [Propionibacteriaceae bacterium]
MSDPDDIRAGAAERLTYLWVLQLQAQRRFRADAPRLQDTRQGQGRVLALLKLKPELTQRELTFLMGGSRQSLAELLAKLERQGLIEREPSADDRRVLTVRLTQAGRDVDQANDSDGGVESLLDCLDDDEVTRLADYLDRMIARLEEAMGGEFDARRQAIGQYLREGGFGPGGPATGGLPGLPGWRGFDPRHPLGGPADPRLRPDGTDPRLNADGTDPRLNPDGTDPRAFGPRGAGLGRPGSAGDRRRRGVRPQGPGYWPEAGYDDRD